MVEGTLPDSSDGVPESSTYFGFGPSVVTALGVARANPIVPVSTRYIAIAAGTSYPNLNRVQCEMRFVPKLFSVTASPASKEITVDLLPDVFATQDMEATGNLAYVTARQFALISNDQTNLYLSLVGESLNASISDYATSISFSDFTLNENPNRSTEVTLIGVTNCIAAMADDMLLAYAIPQLMIANARAPRLSLSRDEDFRWESPSESTAHSP